MKDIVIVANFVSALDRTDNNRFSYLAEYLSDEFQVELIASDFYHAKKCKRQGDYSNFPFKVTLLHEPGYPKNVCLERFYSHSVFGKNVKKYLEQRKKPDAIYCAVPSLDAAKAAADYAKKNGIHLIIDIQDLWPEAFKMVFKIPIISDLIFMPMVRKANAIYKSADDIIAVSRTYCERALSVNEKCSETHTVFLGTKLSVFDNNAKTVSYTKKSDDEIWLTYCGTLGSSYDLKLVIDALAVLKERKVKLPVFLVLGDGPKKELFESYAKSKDLDIRFLGRLPYDEMCGILAYSDISVNPIVPGAAQSIINKHADYAAAGIPVLNSQECMEYRDLVDKFKMGLNCKNGDAKDMADKLETLLTDSNLRTEMGKGARNCAEQCFDREKTYGEIAEILRRGKR